MEGVRGVGVEAVDNERRNKTKSKPMETAASEAADVRLMVKIMTHKRQKECRKSSKSNVHLVLKMLFQSIRTT